VVLRVGGVLAAGAAAALALWSFWPRKFPVLEPSPLRTYLRAEATFTQLTVLDTMEDFVNEGSAVLEGKGRRLRSALVALAVAAALFAAGIVVETLQG
jgi:hypothetical protein